MIFSWNKHTKQYQGLCSSLMVELIQFSPVPLLLLLYKLLNDSAFLPFPFTSTDPFRILSFSPALPAPPSDSLLPHTPDLPLPSLRYRNLVNKPFRPHLLCSLITHAIFIHGCHSRGRISAIIHSSPLSRILIFAALFPPPPAHPYLSVSHYQFYPHFLSFLPPFSPVQSPALFPICVDRKSKTSLVFSHALELRGTVMGTVYLFMKDSMW